MVPASDALASARVRRATLKLALSDVEIAAASPSGEPGWRRELGAALERLRHAFDDHVHDVEDPGGLFDALMEDAPHLAHQIATVRDEHPPLCRQIEDAIDAVESGPTPRAVRNTVLAALSGVARHRQHGADLVYNAYTVDIGTGD